MIEFEPLDKSQLRGIINKIYQKKKACLLGIY